MTKIIDFHTHPFKNSETNICSHKEYCRMTPESTLVDLKKLGVEKICGSVINMGFDKSKEIWPQLRRMNEIALELKEQYGDFYYPGYHVHPQCVRQSVAEIEKIQN